MVFVVFACRIFGKTALQATLRVFGLCGSCVVLVWADLWFLVTCGFFGSVVLPSMLMPTVARRDCASDCASSCSLWFGGLALDAEADGCASTCPQVFVDRWSCPRCRCLPVVLRVHLPAGIARPLGSPTAKRSRSNCKRWLGCPLW